MRQGLVEFALRPQNAAQVVVHLGEVGTQRKNLAISRGRLGQPPGTMVALGLRNESVESAGSSGVGRAVVIRCRSRWLPVVPTQ